MTSVDGKIKIWVTNGPRQKKIDVIAAFAEVEFEFPPFTFGASNTTPDFLKKNPIGRVPVLELPDGRCIFESGAVFHYIAALDKKKALLGRNDFEAAEVNQWLYFSIATIEPPCWAWLAPVFGYRDFDQKAHTDAVGELKRVFEALNRWLVTRTYLVGERLTAADLSVATTLLPLYRAVLDPKFRRPYANVNRWFETITQQEKFRNAWGLDPNAWCTVAQTAPKKPTRHDVKAASKAERKAIRPKNPFDLLPKSSFALDAFKREFSTKHLDEALDYFYKNFDPAGYTLWYARYKYPHELAFINMSTGLINGMFQRMDALRAYAFGVMSIFGEDNKSEIAGLWVFRGTGDALPELLLQVDDTAHYEWTQIDFANIEGEKAKIYAYLNGDDIDGQPYAEGKTFK